MSALIHRRRSTGPVAALLLPMAATVAVLSGPPAAAAATPRPVPHSVAMTEAQASAKARITHRPVAVGADTTTYSNTVANPDGTFTDTVSSTPEQVFKNGAWVPLDSTLQQNSNGTYSPAASTGGLVLSGGGGGPLAVMTNQGRQLTIGWPTTLPAPTVSGNKATYTNTPIFGVSLIVVADDEGGFIESMSVVGLGTEAILRQNPVVQPVSTVGVALQGDADSNISAADSDGTPYFAAPTPMTWDSFNGSETDPPAAPVEGPSPDDPQSGLPAVSTAQAPGEYADVSPLPTTVTTSSVTFTSTFSTTNFPVFLTATWHNLGNGDPSNGWAQAQYAATDSARANTRYWEPSGLVQVGYTNWPGANPPFKSHGFWQIPIGSVPHGSATALDIESASVTFAEDYAPICSISGHDTSVHAYTTGPINSTTTWNTQPSHQSDLGTNSEMHGYNSTCVASSIEFTATTPVTTALRGTAQTMTFDLQADDETDKYGWKKFGHTATLQVNYDRQPNTPASESSSPGAGGCKSDPTTDLIGNAGVTLSAIVSDPDGDALTTEFKVINFHGSTVLDSNAVQVSSGGTSRLTIPASTIQSWHVDGGSAPYQYSWQARTSDGNAAVLSNWGTLCSFTYDPGHPESFAPSNVTIDAAPIPASGGSVTFTPDKTNGGEDPASYTYQVDDLTQQKITVGTTGCTTDACVAPLPTISRIGPHWITAIAFTAAGDASDPARVQFNTTAPTAAYQPGDLTGDGHGDLVVAGGSGTGQPAGLWLYQGTGAGGPNATGVDIGARGDGISTTGGPADFTGTLVTTGDFTARGIGDVLVYIPSTAVVQILRGTGNGGVLDPSQAFPIDQQQLCPPKTTFGFCGLAGTGITLTSLVADGDANGDGKGPDLLATTSDGHLWLFPNSKASDGQVVYLPAIAVSGPGVDSANWTSWTVATARAAGQPALYARNTSTGELDLYTTTDLTNALLGGPLSTKQVVAASGFTATADPVLTGGDINSDPQPDLWISGHGTTVTGDIFNGTSFATTNTTTVQPTDGWSLSDGPSGTSGGTAADLTGAHQATLGTNTAWVDDPDHVRGTVTQYDNETLASASTTNVLNTQNSYSVSAWVYPTSADGYHTAAGQDATTTYGFKLGIALGTWEFALPDTDTSNPVQSYTLGGTANLNTWTFLTGVYDKAAGKGYLYVNGVLAGSMNVAARGFNATGSFAIGRDKYNGANTDFWQGDLGSIMAYQSALSASQVTTVYNQISVSGTPNPISYVSSATVTGTATSETVTVPATVQAGDLMLLYDSANTTSALTAPSGWTLIGSTPGTFTSQTSWVWYRIATGTDHGTTVTVGNGTTSTKAAVVLAAYRGARTSSPINAFNVFTTSASTSSVTSPTVTVTGNGCWLVSYWNSKSSTVTSWAAPTGQTTRATAYGSGSGYMDSILTDANASTASGTAGGLTATTNVAAGSDVSWTIAINAGP